MRLKVNLEKSGIKLCYEVNFFGIQFVAWGGIRIEPSQCAALKGKAGSSMIVEDYAKIVVNL